MDNLRTNHRGTFVLKDNTFRWLTKLSVDPPPLPGAAAARGVASVSELARDYLVLPCALVRLLRVFGANNWSCLVRLVQVFQGLGTRGHQVLPWRAGARHNTSFALPRACGIYCREVPPRTPAQPVCAVNGPVCCDRRSGTLYAERITMAFALPCLARAFPRLNNSYCNLSCGRRTYCICCMHHEGYVCLPGAWRACASGCRRCGDC